MLLWRQENVDSFVSLTGPMKNPPQNKNWQLEFVLFIKN